MSTNAVRTNSTSSYATIATSVFTRVSRMTRLHLDQVGLSETLAVEHEPAVHLVIRASASRWDAARRGVNEGQSVLAQSAGPSRRPRDERVGVARGADRSRPTLGQRSFVPPSSRSTARSGM